MASDLSNRPPTGLSAGFEGYLSPSDKEYRAVLTSGLIVLDTNVLLNLYRFDEETRTDLIAILQRLSDALWIPHQALEEFWRNREQTILTRMQHRREAINSLARPIRAIEDTISAWARSVGLPEGRLMELRSLIQGTHETLQNAIQGPPVNDPLSDARDTNHDPILASLQPMFAGRVGERLSSDDLAKALREAERRAEADIPPGYMDRDKPDNRGAGDYLVWEQTLLEATTRETDVLFVTSDLKEDWWRKVRGTPVGPRVELVNELRRRAGTKLFMLQPHQLLGIGGRLLDISIRPNSESQIARIAGEAVADGNASGDAVDLYLATALRQILPHSFSIEVNPRTGGTRWNLSVTGAGKHLAKVWVYDPIKPFNDLATGSVTSTADSMVSSFQESVSGSPRPWLACVVDLTNLVARLRSGAEPWRRRESNPDLMAEAHRIFKPHISDLERLGFDTIEVIMGLDELDTGEGNVFAQLDRIVDSIASLDVPT